jgi:hypothetical protein
MPIAMVTVTTMGSPSGIVEQAAATAVVKRSLRLIPRKSPRMIIAEALASTSKPMKWRFDDLLLEEVFR